MSSYSLNQPFYRIRMMLYYNLENITGQFTQQAVRVLPEHSSSC